MKQFYSSRNQVGYTCGIYCLEIANSIIIDSPIKFDSYYNTIQNCIDKSYTKIGEVFDIDMLNTIACDFYPNIATKVCDITCVNDIDKLLNNFILVMPVLSEKTPHYIVLIKNENGSMRHYNNGLHFDSLKKLYKRNSQIKFEYIWPKTILNDSFASKLAEKALIYNHEVLSYRQKYKENIFKKAKEKHIINIGDIDRVNMRGKCLIVSRAFKTGC